MVQTPTPTDFIWVGSLQMIQREALKVAPGLQVFNSPCSVNSGSWSITRHVCSHLYNRSSTYLLRLPVITVCAPGPVLQRRDRSEMLPVGERLHFFLFLEQHIPACWKTSTSLLRWPSSPWCPSSKRVKKGSRPKILQIVSPTLSV